MSAWVSLAPPHGPPQGPHHPVRSVVLDVLAAEPARGDVRGHLEAAVAVGEQAPRPARGSTQALWEALATLAAHDLQLARAVEPHLDALAILDEAAAGPGTAVSAPAGSTWGVFAAEGPGGRLGARPHEAGWWLEGTKPWCSLASHLTHALVTAWTDDATRGLFALDLREPAVVTDRGGSAWVARGLPDVTSTAIEVSGVVAQPVGQPGWYLRRDGFAWGGIGVAAVWYGGAVALARRLARPSGRAPDQVAHLHLGRVDQHLSAARAVLGETAGLVDSGQVAGPRAAELATRVRSVVAASAEAVLAACEHGLGPGPQVAEPAYAAGLADLRLYLRQHHAERDLAALGRGLEETGAWWAR